MRSLSTSTLLVIAVAAGLAACGENDGADAESRASNSSVEGSFSIQVSNGTGFDHTNDRASVEAATDSMFGFKAKDWHVRIDPTGLPETGTATTTEFGRNNTSIWMYVDIDGKKRRVGCDPADPEVGSFTRSELTENTVSGDFTIEFVECSDYFDASPVAAPGLPFTVTGLFKDIPRSDT